ncbi:MAG: hemerythrin family protein [Candidatus Omnitrophica bacterium]|nr:hemerythrin family protein [Candidatus Omnitrophota bacterium]
MIEWDQERYSSGVDSIDKQHRMLFEFFNDFEECIKNGKGMSYLEVSFPLLEAYAKAHFKFEEDCMNQHQCPFAKENKDAHQAFIVKVEEVKKTFASGQCGDELLMQVHDFIEKWITNHIIGVDIHLKGCVKK